jgi:tetratricopeptide (TPR) repeat protein
MAPGRRAGRASRSGWCAGSCSGPASALLLRREMPILPAHSGHSCQHRAVSDDDVPPHAPQPDEAALQPDEVESAYELLQRGTALMRRRHNAQAAVVLERAARLEPGKGSILEALGRAYFTSGQHERARETFEALLEVDPSSHYGHYALGRSLKNLGRPREARTHLRLAVALSPTTTMYRAALARLPPPEDREP